MTTYALPADSGIRNIERLWTEIKALIAASNGALEVDAQALARPDTALVQLLAVAVVRAREQGKSVKIVGASQRLRELVSLLALDVVMGD